MASKSRLTLLVVFCLTLAAPLPLAAQAAAKQPAGLAGILHYISNGWAVLTRSMNDCRSFRKPGERTPPVLYFPADFPIPASEKALEKTCSVRLEHLPSVITHLGGIDVGKIQSPGLLYLNYPYVVPGGFFNEMYGWDSYFIIRGLLGAGKIRLARGMVENFFFEIDHYGGILNANRTYFLTRSQPPFLTSMIRLVYDAEKSQGGDARGWLEQAYHYAVKDYQLWIHAPHLAGDTGLSRYFGLGHGPVPEMGAGAPAYYGGAVRYFLRHPETADSYLRRSSAAGSQADAVGPEFTQYLCAQGSEPGNSQGCKKVDDLSLTPDFYEGDRSMRESGFDISFRFGPYGAGTHHFAAVGLNSLLYKAEKDLEWMSAELGRAPEASQWAERAAERRQAMNKYFWNQERGLFFDYDFTKQEQSSYQYATTFYPLWAGWASPEQAKAVERSLKIFERPGGLAMSPLETTAQWDYPYGWAPVNLIAVEGLRRYGDSADADRLSFEFLATVLKNFRRDGTIREKYNVVTGSSEVRVKVGYAQNVVGFGWTNGTFLQLLHELPPDWVARLQKE
jgi:alpha,alpha-trehalase